jgi:hypothetical protein
MSTLSARVAARLVLGAAAIGAGVIHLALTPEHLREWVPLGVGFLAAGVAQLGWGGYVCVRDSRRALFVGGVGSLLFLAVYLTSRTVGLPVGPDAFAPEPFGRADLLCCALEVPVALGGLLLARRPRAGNLPLGRRLTVVASSGLVLVLGATTLALTAPAHAHGAGQHAACPAAPVHTGILDARGVDTGVTAYFGCLLAHEHAGHQGAGH